MRRTLARSGVSLCDCPSRSPDPRPRPAPLHHGAIDMSDITAKITWPDGSESDKSLSVEQAQALGYQPTPSHPSDHAASRHGRAGFDPSRMQWQPISTAPKDGTWVLVYRRRSDTQDDIEAAQYNTWIADKKAWMKGDISFPTWDEPTHWMPLPELPVTPADDLRPNLGDDAYGCRGLVPSCARDQRTQCEDAPAAEAVGREPADEVGAPYSSSASSLAIISSILRHWDKFNVQSRYAEGLDTADDTHVITVPPHWPTHGTLRKWASVLEDAAQSLTSPSPAQEREGAAPPGWVLVPREPTKEMLLAGNDGIDDDIDSWNYDSGCGYCVEPQAARNVWDRMLSASPPLTPAGRAALQTDETGR